MEIGRISVRYAKALLEFARDNHAEDTVHEEMHTLAEAFQANPELKTVLGNPTLTDEEKKRLLTVAAGGQICETTKRFLQFVVGKKQEACILFIAMAYKTLYCKEKKIVFAELTTADDLQPSTEKRIMSIIEKAYGSETIRLVTKKNPELIGGFVLNIDQTKLDGSISGELKLIKRELGIA